MEYRAGVTECSDCRAPLVIEKPQAQEHVGDPNLELVSILEANDPFVIASAKGLLEEAGIPFYVLGEELGARYGPVGPFIHPWCRVEVAADRQEEAGALLQEIKTGGVEPEQS